MLHSLSISATTEKTKQPINALFMKQNRPRCCDRIFPWRLGARALSWTTWSFLRVKRSLNLGVIYVFSKRLLILKKSNILNE